MLCYAHLGHAARARRQRVPRLARGGGAAALECLLAQSASALFNASYAAEPGDLPFGDSWYSCQWAPVVDGVELSDTPAALLAARGADASAVDAQGHTLIHLACSNGHVATAGALRELNVSRNRITGVACGRCEQLQELDLGDNAVRDW